jgi:hypothetical protein
MWKDYWKKLISWIRRMINLYEKEIKEFVNEMLDLAFQNLNSEIVRKIDPAIRKKITNKVLADILIMKIDITTTQGKSKVCELVMDSITWFTKEEAK